MNRNWTEARTRANLPLLRLPKPNHAAWSCLPIQSVSPCRPGCRFDVLKRQNAIFKVRNDNVGRAADRISSDHRRGHQHCRRFTFAGGGATVELIDDLENVDRRKEVVAVDVGIRWWSVREARYRNVVATRFSVLITIKASIGETEPSALTSNRLV